MEECMQKQKISIDDSNDSRSDLDSTESLNQIGISLYEKGDITLLKEILEDDWYAPQLIYYKTIIFRDNKSGDCYSIKQKIRHKIKVTRNNLSHFGDAAKTDSVSNKGLTTFGEEVFIEHPDKSGKKKDKLKEVVPIRVSCRNCGGQHWTHACSVSSASKGKEKDEGKGKETSHYVPPTMRRDAEERRVTVKISNIPEDTDRDQLQELFNPCGRIYRINVPRDKKTGEGRGFAFIDFNDRDGAISAVVMMNGHRIGYQVISVEFALDKDGNKKEIVIDGTAQAKAEEQFKLAKKVEAKRTDVYQPAPRESRRGPRDPRDSRDRRTGGETVPTAFSRGSLLRASTSQVRSGSESRSGMSGGWQPRSRSERSSGLERSGGFRSRPAEKSSFGKSFSGGWGDRSKKN